MQTTFKTIGLVVRQDVQLHLETLRQVTSILKSQAEVLIHYLDLDVPVKDLPNVPMIELVEHVDMVISLGGDGTLLTAARALVETNTPLLGINLGRLGFLADVSIKDVEQHLKDVLDGRYRVEKRFFIKGEFFHQGKLISTSIALNDIIVHSNESLSMIEYEVYDYLNTRSIVAE